MADSLSLINDGDTPSGQFNSEPTSVPPNVTATLMDVAVLISYIRRVVPALFGDDTNSESLRELLLSEATMDLLRRFISEPQTRAILIQRQMIKGNVFF